MQLEDFKLSEQ